MASSTLPRYSTLPQLITLFLTLFALSFSSTIHANNENDQEFARSLNPKKFFGLKKQKLSHFKFYFHDIYSGPNPTAVQIVKSPTNNSVTGFGFVSMIDDPLTLGPSLSSKLVGRAQGLYGLASIDDPSALLMAMNFVFVEGKYNGSTLSILGRNRVFDKVREMPITGGSGLFRFATGYVHATTYVSTNNGDALVEYNAYVLHY